MKHAETNDIYDMRKAAKTMIAPSKAKRSVRKSPYLGRTEDGLLIQRPDFKPESFTIRQLDKVVREVKRRLAAEAG